MDVFAPARARSATPSGKKSAPLGCVCVCARVMEDSSVSVSHMAETIEARRDDVRAWQRYYNMTPREDSRLTELYAYGQTDPRLDASAVARELLATDYLYKHSLYGEVLEDFLRRVAQELRTYHPTLSWTATWDIVRFYGPSALKLMCVSSGGLTIPDRLPEP